MLPTSTQKGLSRVGHERPLNTNSEQILYENLARAGDQPQGRRAAWKSHMSLQLQ